MGAKFRSFCIVLGILRTHIGFELVFKAPMLGIRWDLIRLMSCIWGMGTRRQRAYLPRPTTIGYNFSTMFTLTCHMCFAFICPQFYTKFQISNCYPGSWPSTSRPSARMRFKKDPIYRTTSPACLSLARRNGCRGCVSGLSAAWDQTDCNGGAIAHR
jgi:hypothetical protein